MVAIGNFGPYFEQNQHPGLHRINIEPDRLVRFIVKLDIVIDDILCQPSLLPYYNLIVPFLVDFFLIDERLIMPKGQHLDLGQVGRLSHRQSLFELVEHLFRIVREDQSALWEYFQQSFVMLLLSELS